MINNRCNKYAVILIIFWLNLTNSAPECNESMTGIGAVNYRGCQNKTANGLSCQPWTSQIPHSHGRTPENFPNKGLGNHSYCRNPDGEPTIWCYTMDSNCRWDFCNPIGEETTNNIAPNCLFSGAAQAVDCVLGEWYNDGECSTLCGTGIQNQKKDIITPAENGGDCGATTQQIACNTQSCCPNGIHTFDWDTMIEEHINA
eukprot:188630_1